MALVEKQLATRPEYMSSPPVFSGVRVARSLVFYVVLCRSVFVFLSFFFWSLQSVLRFIDSKPRWYVDISPLVFYCSIITIITKVNDRNA